MYTITLANGKKLTGLDMNGTNYVSKEKVDKTIFKDNLSTMKVSDGETETTYTDMVFVQQMEWADSLHKSQVYIVTFCRLFVDL